MERAQQGDGNALDVLLRAHYDRLFAVCRRMIGNESDAADATQEALIAIARSLRRFDGHSRFSTWAYRIAVNCSIDELRRQRRRVTVTLDDRHELVGRAALRSDPSDPEQVANRLDIEAALQLLPVEYRSAVVLRDLCGLDYAEIAEVLDLPPGTVRSRIARGRGALARLLEPTRSES